MKKTLLVGVLPFWIFTHHFSQAQEFEFNHALGASYIGASNGTTVSASILGIQYAPRLNLLNLSDEMSLSMGSYLTLGFSFSTTNEADNFFVLEAPILAEFNYGLESTSNSDGSFGLNAGVGYGFARYGNSNGSFNISALYLSANARFNAKTLPVTAGVYTFLGDGEVSAIGIRFLVNLSELKETKGGSKSKKKKKKKRRRR